MKTYLVGGAVRDKLLGITPKEYDWVVVGATEQEMLDKGYQRLDREFPVFRHPKTGDEYALARSETKTGAGYKGFTVEATPDITLEQDLRRRDLTINAIAEDSTGQLIDPCNGKADLEARKLRHITPAFIEDPVRLLRVARFAARLADKGFQPAETTLQLMRQMVASDDFKALKAERIWRELQRALTEPDPAQFFIVLHRCGALVKIVPALDRAIAGHENTPTIQSLRRITADSSDPRLRFAVVMYEAALHADEAPRAICDRLRAEWDYCDYLELVMRCGSLFYRLSPKDPEAALVLLEQAQAFRKPERFAAFLTVCRALWPDRQPHSEWLGRAYAAASAVSTAEIDSAGVSGKELGVRLRNARLKTIAVIESP